MSSHVTRGLIIAMVATNALWAYLLVDRSVTIQYQSDALTRDEGRIELLAKLVSHLASGFTVDQFVERVKQASPTTPLKQIGDTVEVDGLIVEFNEGVLTRVTPM